jgi:hypothetical protein
VQPNVVSLTAKDKSAVFEFQSLMVEWNPAERPMGALGFPPIEPRLAVLLARGVVLLANLLYGLRMQVEAFFSCAAGELIEVVPVEPSAAPLNRLDLRLVREIPDKVHRRRLCIKSRGVLVFHTESVGELHHALPNTTATAALSVPALKDGAFRVGFR